MPEQMINAGIKPKTGVLLVNLGTPDAPTPAALRRYLAQFLSDPRVVEAPRWLWRLALYGFILRTRPRRSAHAYQSIWTPQGSPLLVNSERQLQAIAAALRQQHGGSVVCVLGMRYGNPSLPAALRTLQDAGIERLLVLPLYPQYSGTTTGSTFDALSAELQRWRRVPALQFVDGYHDFEPYIEAMAAQLRRHFAEHGRVQKLLLSFHGIPAEYAAKGDPYPEQCRETARLLARALKLGEADWQLVFQSRFGPREWLQPYADRTLRSLPQQGVKRVAVFCPGFAVDCLETLEEMAVMNRKLFLEAGGEGFDYVPALNAEAEHIAALTALIEQRLQGWG
ncbi:MAG TPA: ferrochelatase [Gammaproteobacteria bacterium]|nr:ferrochelatase [Gammaproteobacteria bacterium]